MACSTSGSHDSNTPALDIIRSKLTTIFQSDQRQSKASINLSISVQIIRVGKRTQKYMKRERSLFQAKLFYF